MSTNFTGITFAQQKVAPSDDAIIRRAILPDGILTGCELSYSGSTLTMASGQLLICGRQIRHPSAQNWAVVDATTGYARLLLTIDLTRTSSKEVFDQVVDTIEYASAVDGFPDLEQADINGSGTRYQVVACVASLGTGGISGIVSQLGKSVVDGAGGVNFKVVGGVTLPSDPIENTIWVNTEAKITDWMFSSEQPQEASEGLVWIKTDLSSAVAFNALKKNGIQVYPVRAKQYVSSAWVDKTAKSYQSGAWVDWWDGSLSDSDFNNGLGPFSTRYIEGQSSTFGLTATNKMINLTGYSTITFDADSTADINKLFVTTVQSGSVTVASGGDPEKNAVATWSERKAGGTKTLDISGISGKYYLVFFVGSNYGTSGTATFSNVVIS